MNELMSYVDKLQAVCREMYEEGNEATSDLVYTCPLTEILDAMYEFSLMDCQKAIHQKRIKPKLTTIACPGGNEGRKETE